MEKLIELLNEYNRNVLKYSDVWKLKDSIDNPGKKYISLSSVGAWKIYLWIISKEYGFIKWLVENDKIDFEKCGFNIKNYLSYNKRYDKGIVLAENYDNDTFVVREFYSPYEQLLMLLSISDNPIEFLIFILK